MKKSYILFVILALSLIRLTASAVTKTSTGNGNWNVAGTWSPSGVPASNDSIVINHNITLNVDIELTAGGKLTINSGASLIGNTATRRIGYTLSNTGPSVRVTNYGTLTIGQYNRTNSGGNSNDDHYFDNYGIFNLTDNIDCNGSASAFAIAWGVFTNHSGAVINCSPCFYVGGGSSQAEFHNSGEIFFNCSTCSSAFSVHSMATLINHPGGKVTAVELMTLGGLDQHNYGCINALGGIRVFEKSNNAGSGTFTLHDDSKIFVPSGQQFNVNSNTTLIGIDDDNNNANNACVSTQTNVTNSGTITGEFYLNDPDGLVSGTVGPNVVLGTGNCGGACSSPSCAISGVTATPGPCNSGNNQYTLTGDVTFTNAPTSGTLTITVSGGGIQVINAPFTSPTSYSIAGLTSDGVSHTVTAVFSADANCTGNTSFTAPASCVTSGCTGGAFTYPNFQTLGWQSSPLACGTNNGNISQLFNNYLGSGVGATFTYSTNMWDGDAPNLYLASPASGGCDNQFNTTIDDQHCASNYHGALRFTNNQLSSGETFVEVSFSSPVYLDLARVGSISRLSGGNYEWFHVIAYDANNTIVPISTSNMVGGYMDCSNNITSGGMNFIADGAGGVYVNPTAIILQSNGLYGHADITIPNVAIQKLRFEHWAAPSTTDHTLRAAVYSSVIMNVLCVSPACVKPNAGSNITALPGSCYNLTGSNPTTGLWNPLAGNPTGATLGTTVNGTAQVCFANTAVGVFGFTYSISTGCEDTMYVTINPVIAQPCANTTLWAINEDNGHLFSVLNWSSQTGVNTTTIDWGLIKWSSNNCVSSTNINISGGSEIESAAWDGATSEYYFTSNKTLGSYTKPVLLKLDMNNLILGQQPCAVVIGSIATGGADIESLAIDPATGVLYGGTKNGGDLYRINRNTAAIETGYPVQMVKPGGGNLNNSESMAFDYSGNLYVSETDDQDVYIIDKLTGVGISTFDNNTAPLGLDGITWDFSGNRLIGFEDNSGNGFSNLIEITPGNGNNITIANTFSAGLVDIEGLELACPIVGLSCLGNYVWNDVNQNGIQESGEPGINGVVVTLYECVNGDDFDFTNPVEEFTTIDGPGAIGDGYYQFCGLDPNKDYNIVIHYSTSQIPLIGQSPINQGSDDTQDSDFDGFVTLTGLGGTMTGCIDILPGINDDFDAGFFEPASLGDFVWYDVNGNGLQDSGEPGLGEVSVTLYSVDANGVQTFFGTATTDQNGFYEFTGLTVGQDYVVQFGTYPGYLFTNYSGTITDLNNSDIGPSGVTGVFTLQPGNNPYVDAGFIREIPNTCTMGGTAWFDFNGAGHPTDGIQGEIMVGTNPYPEVTGGGSETPDNQNSINQTLVSGTSGIFPYIGGAQYVAVSLVNADGETLFTTQTDPQGNYVFNNLVCATYTVMFDPSAVQTVDGTAPIPVTPNVGTNDLVDSDGMFDETTNAYITEPISLVFGQDDFSTDFGLTAVVLPIVLKSFDGNGLNCQVTLTWVTSSEKDNKQFIVERSLDGINFSIVGTREGKRSSTEETSYLLIDDKIGASGYYYRLIQEDLDKTRSIIASKYISSACDKYNQVGISGIYPNPVVGNTKVIMKYNSNISSKAVVTITTVDGKVISLNKTELFEGLNSLSIDLEDLPAGAYFIQVTGAGLPLSVKKLIKTE